MTLQDPHHRLRLASEAAWNRYASTVLCGGTPEQRQWAFDRALDAQDKLAVHERHTNATSKTTELPAVPAT